MVSKSAGYVAKCMRCSKSISRGRGSRVRWRICVGGSLVIETEPEVTLLSL